MPTRNEGEKPLSLKEFQTQYDKLVSEGQSAEASALAKSFNARLASNRNKTLAKTRPEAVKPVEPAKPVKFGQKPPEEPKTSAVTDDFHLSSDQLEAGEYFPTAEAPSVETSEPAKPMESQTGLAHDSGECEHCGWLKGRPDIEPDEADLTAFAIALEGDRAFQKEYHHVQGKMTCRFRDMPIPEIDLCNRQVTIDIEKGRVAPGQAALEMLHRYLLVGSLSFLRLGDAAYEFPESIKEWDVEVPEGETPIGAVYERLSEEVVKSSSAWRILSKTHGQFRRLVSKLEANSDNDPFWDRAGSGG